MSKLRKAPIKRLGGPKMIRDNTEDRIDFLEECIEDLKEEIYSMQKWIDRLEQDIGFERNGYIG